MKILAQTTAVQESVLKIKKGIVKMVTIDYLSCWRWHTIEFPKHFYHLQKITICLDPKPVQNIQNTEHQ